MHFKFFPGLKLPKILLLHKLLCKQGEGVMGPDEETDRLSGGDGVQSGCIASQSRMQGNPMRSLGIWPHSLISVVQSVINHSLDKVFKSAISGAGLPGFESWLCHSEAVTLGR